MSDVLVSDGSSIYDHVKISVVGDTVYFDTVHVPGELFVGQTKVEPEVQGRVFATK